MNTAARIPRVLAAIALTVAVVGCISTKPKKKSGLMRSAREITFAFTAEDLRLLMRDAVGPVSGMIEETADRIMSETTDPAVRRAALVWKLDAMPAYREALFRGDPIAAILDSLALTIQMEQYFETGPGREIFGAGQTLAIEACRRLEQSHLDLLDRIVLNGDPGNAIQLVRDWAVENPITTSIASRDSIMNAVGAIERQSGTFGRLASGIGVTLDDMVRRVEIYSDQLPRQSRWQAELMVMDLLAQHNISETLAELPDLIDTVQRVARSLEDWDAVIARERELTIADIDRQRRETLEFTSARLEEVLAFVRAERMAVVDDVERERIAATNDAREELRWVVEALQQERELILTEAGALTEARLEEALDRVDLMVDRILFKVALFLAVCMIVAAVLALVVVRTARRPA